jgi:hypothetical protein
MKLNKRGILKGPIPCGITWRLVLMKVLPQPPRPIRVYMESKRKGGGGGRGNKQLYIMNHFPL